MGGRHTSGNSLMPLLPQGGAPQTLMEQFQNKTPACGVFLDDDESSLPSREDKKIPKLENLPLYLYYIRRKVLASFFAVPFAVFFGRTLPVSSSPRTKKARENGRLRCIIIWFRWWVHLNSKWTDKQARRLIHKLLGEAKPRQTYKLTSQPHLLSN